MRRSSTEIKSQDAPTPASARSVNHERFASQWKDFEDGFRGLSEFSQYIGKLEHSLHNEKKLESDIQNKNKEISVQQAARQQVIEGFEVKYQKWQKCEKKLEDDLRSAKHEVENLRCQVAEWSQNHVTKEDFHCKIEETKNDASQRVSNAVKGKDVEIQKLKRAADGSEKKVKKLVAELSEKTTTLLGTQVQLKDCQADLEKMNTEIGLEELSVDFASMLKKLSEKSHDLARTYFFTALPKEINADDVFVNLQRSQLMSAVSRIIPISNTEASKHLRMAAAESVMAKHLVEKIFQPLFILDPIIRDSLVDVLDKLSLENPRQESILRSLLLTGYHLRGNIQDNSILEAVVNKTLGILHPLLFDKACTDAFRMEFGTLLREALDLWNQAQKSPKRILASTEGVNWDWDSHKEHDDAVSLTVAEKTLFSRSEEPVMTLFPKIYIPGGPEILHQGFAVWSNQNTFMAGKLESKEQIARVHSRDETHVVGRRRFSVNSDTTNASFHQRMKSRSKSIYDPNTEK